MREYRWLYLLYFIIFIPTAIILDYYFDFTDSNANTASYIATVSEIFGISIAITEILVVKNIVSLVKEDVNNFQSYSDITFITNFINHISDEIINQKYGKAIVRLETVIRIYQENLSQTELQNLTSIHRINYDNLNAIIIKLRMKENKKLTVKETADFLKFLGIFNKTIIDLKITLKKAII